MKIPFNQVNSKIKDLPGNFKGILLFGNDNGMIYERSKVIKKIIEKKKGSLVEKKYDYEQLKKDSSFVYEQASNLSFFAEYNFFEIENSTPTATKSIKDLLSFEHSNSFFVFLANELPPSSSLRQFFEKSPDYLSLGCYVDDVKVIQQIIRKFLSDNSIIHDHETLSYLEQNIQGDRKHILNELQKVLVYLGDKKDLSLSDLEDLICNISGYSFDNFSHLVADKKIDKAMYVFNSLIKEGYNIIQIMNNLSDYFYKLYTVKKLESEGINIKDAMLALKPPVFILHRPAFIARTKNFSLDELKNNINEIFCLEVLNKTNYKMIRQQTESTILKIMQKSL